MIVAAWICLLTPLGATLAITLAGQRLSRRGAGYLATGSVAVSFVAAVVTFALLLGDSPDDRSHSSTLWHWLTAGPYQFNLQILVDPLSVFMMLIVAGVGCLIVGYSIGYMDGDDEERRYFAYMALFVFSMLLLVQGGNLLMLLVGWGLVGLSSYLLIGFWHDRPSAVAAAKKAFIMNAVGDATMALALFLLIQRTGSLNFSVVFPQAGSFGGWANNLIALGLLGGAIAKSAQLPLQTWLPDAMEGPTPVSALIHAATMVTAGVYLIVRTHALFEAAPHVQGLAAGLGAATLLVAGLIALVQTDIKRVIAYSTMSQIGYMFLAVGIGAYAGGMFHLMTHAFFKALLFLAAGVVIHALAGEQDLRKMGGLRRLMPRTYWVFVVGALALTGIPPFSGFFSKDQILASALANGGWYGDLLWVAGMIGAFLTAVYTFRMLFMAFWGEPSAFVQEHLMTGSHAHDREGHTDHGRHTSHDHAGEGPFSMTSTVAVLAVLAAFGGWIQVADFWTPITNWLEPVAPSLLDASFAEDATSSVVAVLLGLAGIGLAWWIYADHRAKAPRPLALLEHKFYFDELYDALFYRPAVFLATGLARWVEKPLVAGSVRELAAGVRDLGLGTRRLQSGLVRTYTLAIAASLAVLTVVFVVVR